MQAAEAAEATSRAALEKAFDRERGDLRAKIDESASRLAQAQSACKAAEGEAAAALKRAETAEAKVAELSPLTQQLAAAQAGKQHAQPRLAPQIPARKPTSLIFAKKHVPHFRQKADAPCLRQRVDALDPTDFFSRKLSSHRAL
eukprot:2557261-Pleurochrysis_carterae.AAC.1